MRLNAICVPKWADLAWVTRLQEGSDTATVLHGAKVEAGEDWIAEAVWAGDFSQGAFDQTDLVFGSGLRCRKDGIHIVSPATCSDRLWFCQHEIVWYVSNSLPALLAVSGFSLREDYLTYKTDLDTVETLGLKGCKRQVPAQPGPLEVVCFENLFWDGHLLARCDKPYIDRRYQNFKAYEYFLVETAQQLHRNLSDPRRANAIIPLTTISSGYDSPAASVIARYAGCRHAVTITNATSFFPRSDDGKAICEVLDMQCKRYRHDVSSYRHEEMIWAATGYAALMHYTFLDYPKPLCLLFTAEYGDTVWDSQYHDLSSPQGDMGIGEFRLWQGVLHTVVPLWGISSAQQVNALGASAEMKPWSVGGAYDRPVARRLVEEAGVLRELFGQRKRVVVSNTPFHWPFSLSARRNFARFLKSRGFFSPPGWMISLLRCLAQMENLLHMNFLHKIIGNRRFRPWRRLAGFSLVFHWANEQLKQKYCSGLGEVANKVKKSTQV